MSDNCTAASSLIVSYNAPVAFPIGNTTVTWGVEDAANNTQTAIQIVTLTDSSSFSTIPIKANVSYPSSGEIRLANIDDALSPDGTQYQVVITNSSNCSIVSNLATFSINKITGISPIATAVTQCYGTNYHYTVSTSYPANVVSYQWKGSLVLGTWTNAVDGLLFSGANTATLNIISSTPAESAEFRVYITFTKSSGTCSADSSSRTIKITFLPELTPPAITIVQLIVLRQQGL